MGFRFRKQHYPKYSIKHLMRGPSRTVKKMYRKLIRVWQKDNPTEEHKLEPIANWF